MSFEAIAPDDEVIRTGTPGDISKLFRNARPSVVGSDLAKLPDSDRSNVLTALSPRFAATAFTYLPLQDQARLLAIEPHGIASLLLDNMPPDDRTRLFNHLPPHKTTEMLALMGAGPRKMAVELLGFPSGSVGSSMTPYYVCVSKDWTVQQVLDHVRTAGQDSETLTMIYVVDEQHRLIDDISIRQFLLSPLELRVSEILDYRFVALQATESQDTALRLFRREDRKALPVVDDKNNLIGIVTIDDMLQVAEEASTRETQRIGGSEALDEPHMTTALGRMIKK